MFLFVFKVCNCYMFCCTLLYVHSNIAIILMGKREQVALLVWSSWCLVMVEWLFLAVPWGCLRFVIVVFPDHTHYFLFTEFCKCACAKKCYAYQNASYFVAIIHKKFVLSLETSLEINFKLIKFI